MNKTTKFNLHEIMKVSKFENAHLVGFELSDQDIITDVYAAFRTYLYTSIAMNVEGKGWILVKMDHGDARSFATPAFFSYACFSFLKLTNKNVANELKHAKESDYIGNVEEVKQSVLGWLPHLTDATWRRSIEILFEDE